MKHTTHFFTFLVLIVASVMFLTMPVSANITNAGFELGDFTGWNFNVREGSDVITSPYPEIWGEYTCRVYNDDNRMWQNVNFSDHDLLSYDYYYSSGGWINTKSFELRQKDFGAFVLTVPYTGPTDTVNRFEFDISGYEGEYTVCNLIVSMGGGKIFYLDNITLDNVPLGGTVEYNNVFWGQDIYYTGETATIVTDIVNYNDTKYSYYLDLYNTQEYLTTFEITNESESNFYTFPTEWTDTSLLAKLQRTLADGTEEVNLAMDLSHFKTLEWDTTVSFDQSSYDPGETLTVTWSGVAPNSTIWLRAMDDGEKLEVNAAYSGSFQFTVPSNTEETYYLVDVITSGLSQAQSSCVINVGDYWTTDEIYITNYTFSDGDTYGLHDVDRAEYLNITTETNINTDFVDVYYNNVYDDRTVSIDHIETLDGTDQVLKFPNDLGSGQYITIIYYHNVTTGTQTELSYYTNVGEKGEGIDIYNVVITLDDTKEILDIESIAGYGGNDLVVPADRVVIFDIYTDEIINSSTVAEENLYEGDANYNYTSDFHIKRSYLFGIAELYELEFTVHNDATNTDDILKYNVYVQGIDQSDLNGSVVMYWTKSNIEIGGIGLLYFNVSGMPDNPILEITSTTESKYATTRTLHTTQVGTETVLTDEAGVFTATMTCEGVVYAISTLTIVDPDAEIEEDKEDIVFDTRFESMLSSGAFVALLIIIACVGAFGKIGGVVGVFLGMVVGISISFLMGYLPAWILFIMVLALCVVFVSKLINSFGGGE